MKLKALLFKMLAFCLTIVVGAVFTVNRQQTVVFADGEIEEEQPTDAEIAELYGISEDFLDYLKGLFPDSDEPTVEYTDEYGDDMVVTFTATTNEFMDEHITYTCTLDLGSMTFTFTAENASGTMEETFETDAFINDYGLLSTLVTVGTTQYDIGYYQDLANLEDLFYPAEEEQQNTRFLSWLVAAVAIVVTVYVVVAQTATRIKGNLNYQYNITLDNTVDGVSTGNYINDQENKSLDYYAAGNYKFGFTTVEDCGCGPVAIYNLLVAKGEARSLAAIIYDFEILGIEIATSWGHWGSPPHQFRYYFWKHDISYVFYSSESNYKNAIAAKMQGYLVYGAVYMNISATDTVYHNRFGEKKSNNRIDVYNYGESNYKQTSNGIDYLTTAEHFVGNNIVFLGGYIID